MGFALSAIDAHDPFVLRSYEPLVRSTALLIVNQLGSRAEPEDELEDVMQLLRMKVWRALDYFGLERMPRKPGESMTRTRDRFVFMCLMNVKKDIIKRKRAGRVMIEDQRVPDTGEQPLDWFEAKYLSVSHDDIYATVDEPLPLVPNTLTDLERGVLVLLYRDYSHREIAGRLGASKGEVAAAVRALRSKLADWQPDLYEQLEAVL